MVQIVLGKITGELQSELVQSALKRYKKFHTEQKYYKGKLVLHILKAIKFAKIKYNVVDTAQNRLILPVDNFY